MRNNNKKIKGSILLMGVQNDKKIEKKHKKRA